MSTHRKIEWALFLLVFGIFATQYLWLPKLVAYILGGEMTEIVSETNQGTTTAVTRENKYGLDELIETVAKSKGKYPDFLLSEPPDDAIWPPNENEVGSYYILDGDEAAMITPGWDIFSPFSVDGESFQVLSSAYTKDVSNVYLNGVVMDGADPDSFESVLYFFSMSIGEDDYVYGKDSQHVFYRDTILIGADPKTFSVREVAGHLPTWDITTTLHLGYDAGHVYYRDLNLAGINNIEEVTIGEHVPVKNYQGIVVGDGDARWYSKPTNHGYATTFIPESELPEYVNWLKQNPGIY